MNKPNFFVNLLSLFDGIGGAKLALDKVGIPVNFYLASEICPEAIAVTRSRFLNITHLGDVRNIDGRSLKGVINVLTGGSPCQNFSFCGRRKGMITKENVMITTLNQYLKFKNEGFEFEGQSYLFWEFVRLYHEIQPQYFFLENTRMTKVWAKVITKALGVEPITINSKVASAQQRIRMYWTNIPYTKIEDKKIHLSDVIPGAWTGTNAHGESIPEYLKNGVHNWKRGDYKFNKFNKAYCLVTSRGYYQTYDGRRLGYTPEQAEELQNIPQGHTAIPGISNTKRHKMIGNSWTIDVIAEAFFKNLPWTVSKKIEQKTLKL